MRNFRFLIAVIALFLSLNSCSEQKKLESVIDGIYKNSTLSDNSYKMLEYLCAETPGRLPNTIQSEKAIQFIRETLKKNGADSVWLVPVNSSGWKQLKSPETEIIIDENQQIPLNSVSLGQCISTVDNGIEAPIVVISTKEQIDSLGETGIKGKIVFFNGKMKVRGDYGKMAWQRTQGAPMVSKFGAVGVLVRSLTTKYDDNPHTGVVRYEEEYPKIPAVAISWQSADSLEIYLKKNPELKVRMATFCENPGYIKTYNVVGEIRGSQLPDEILLLTGHIDAWFNAQGAQDDGGGISQIVDVIRIFKELNIKPKRTIRVMPYMDEEQYLTGIIDYAAYASKNAQTHLFEIEVDGGLGVPYGFGIQADSAVFTKQDTWRKFLEDKGIKQLRFSNSYANSWPLYQTDKIILSHLMCLDEKYFDYHHSANDVFESVDKKNLQDGSAALAAFIYLLDELDVIDNSKRK